MSAGEMGDFTRSEHIAGPSKGDPKPDVEVSRPPVPGPYQALTPEEDIGVSPFFSQYTIVPEIID